MAYDRRDGHGDGHSFRIESVMYVIDVIFIVMAMVMDIVIGLKL